MSETRKYYWTRKIYRKIHRCFLRRRLKNHDFTLLAPTCIAGVMYHELGMPFLSPTINLWLYDKDFVKFVANLRHYLSQELRFVKIEGENTPVAYLDDILIHFNHYHSEQEAAEKWYARCKRVNYDNLYAIMADQPDGGEITHEDILSLKKLPLRNKAVLSIRDYEDVDYIVHLPKDPVKDCVNMYMFDKSKILARFRWEREWDYVKWINDGVKN